MNDMLSFIYLASLFAVGGAAFSLMWKNISDIFLHIKEKAAPPTANSEARYINDSMSFI